MKCPYCQSLNDKVLESRQADDGNSIRRRRECLDCEKRFTSYERIEPRPLMIIKKDDSRQPFDIAKIESGVMKALEKRPVETSKVEALIERVEQHLYSLNKPEVPSSVIGNLIMAELEALDPVAYVRFASVYRRFKTVDEFVKEVKKLG
jgi:transcriptional repressor NrdR